MLVENYLTIRRLNSPAEDSGLILILNHHFPFSFRVILRLRKVLLRLRRAILGLGRGARPAARRVYIVLHGNLMLRAADFLCLLLADLPTEIYKNTVSARGT